MNVQIDWLAQQISHLICSLTGKRCSGAWGTLSTWTGQSITALIAWRKEDWRKEAADSPPSEAENDVCSTRQTLALFRGQPWGDWWEAGSSAYGPFLALRCHLELKLKLYRHPKVGPSNTWRVSEDRLCSNVIHCHTEIGNAICLDTCYKIKSICSLACFFAACLLIDSVNVLAWWSSHSCDTLPGTPARRWRYRVSAGTSWLGVSILWLGEVESLICSFYLSVAARKIVWADPSLRYTSTLLGR